jgi:hypothetical protein
MLSTTPTSCSKTPNVRRHANTSHRTASFFENSSISRSVGALVQMPPEWHARDAFILMEVTRDGSNYRWLQEWGVPYTTSGTASVVGNQLVLRGCKAYRGKVDDSCDEASPPIYEQLNVSQLFKQHRSIIRALRQSDWIRTDNDSWKSLSVRCEELNNKVRQEEEARGK